MKINQRFYYTIGILIALCATTTAKSQRQDIKTTGRFLRNRKASTNDWDILAFELESSMNQEDAYTNFE